MPLVAREDSLLAVIDLQPRLRGERLDAGDKRRAEEAARRAAWLAAAARALGIPAVITEEDPQMNGPADAAVPAPLRACAPVWPRPCPGWPWPRSWQRSGQQDAGRRCWPAFETDVCVTHSAIGPGQAGYRVVIADDAVYSPSGAHLPGIARLRDLGFELMRCKNAYYDWIRTLPAARAFQEHHPELADPPGFSL